MSSKCTIYQTVPLVNTLIQLPRCQRMNRVCVKAPLTKSVRKKYQIQTAQFSQELFPSVQFLGCYSSLTNSSLFVFWTKSSCGIHCLWTCVFSLIYFSYNATVCRCNYLPTLQNLLRAPFFNAPFPPSSRLHISTPKWLRKFTRMQENSIWNQPLSGENPQIPWLLLVSCCRDGWRLASMPIDYTHSLLTMIIDLAFHLINALK